MSSHQQRDQGFTLVELMMVVLIIGVLVSVAVPVFVAARDRARATSCQANQRTILSAIQMIGSNSGAPQVSTPGELAAGGSGWFTVLVPGWIMMAPWCPTDRANYALDAVGTVQGDQGATPGFKADHQIP